MQDLLDKGLEFLGATRHAHLAREVTYRRGAETVVLRATLGRTEFEQVDEQGFARTFEARDFILRAGDLVLAGETVLPSPGDIVAVEHAGWAELFEVMGRGIEPAWRYTAPDHRELRVHTKFVGREPL